MSDQGWIPGAKSSLEIRLRGLQAVAFYYSGLVLPEGRTPTDALALASALRGEPLTPRRITQLLPTL